MVAQELINELTHDLLSSLSAVRRHYLTVPAPMSIDAISVDFSAVNILPQQNV